jgi:hypothetical protein
MAATGVIFTLFLSWWLLSTLYCAPTWLVAYFKDRQLTLVESWRLAGASLIPGALLLSAAILAYSFTLIDLLSLLILFAIHLVLGWVYLGWGILALPRVAAASVKARNPFESITNAAGPQQKVECPSVGVKVDVSPKSISPFAAAASGSGAENALVPSVTVQPKPNPPAQPEGDFTENPS